MSIYFTSTGMTDIPGKQKILTMMEETQDLLFVAWQKTQCNPFYWVAPCPPPCFLTVLFYYYHMYPTLANSKLLHRVPHHGIIFNNIVGNVHHTFFNIVFQEKTPQNTFFTLYEVFRKVMTVYWPVPPYSLPRLRFTNQYYLFIIYCFIISIPYHDKAATLPEIPSARFLQCIKWAEWFNLHFIPHCTKRSVLTLKFHRKNPGIFRMSFYRRQLIWICHWHTISHQCICIIIVLIFNISFIFNLIHAF